MVGILPTPLPQKGIAISRLTEAVKPARRYAPSKLRRNAERLAAYNMKKHADLIQTCAKSLAQSKIRAREQEMQRGVEKIKSSHKETLVKVTERLNDKIAQLKKQIKDKDKYIAELHVRRIELKKAVETAREAKRSMWIKDRSVKALRRILKACGFRRNHQGHCRHAKFSCDCGRQEHIKAKGFIADIVRLCDVGKHEEAELLIFGDVLKKKGEGKHSSKGQGSREIEHDCSKSPLCSFDYCVND